jgi:hypothetical protein
MNQTESALGDGAGESTYESSPHVLQRSTAAIAMMIQATPRSPMEQKIRSGSSFIGEQLLSNQESRHIILCVTQDQSRN